MKGTEEFESRKVPKKYTIPEDNEVSREAFRNVPGISRFLEKQFVAYAQKEEVALMNYNMGRPKDQQKTIDEWLDPNFAYANDSAQQTRPSKLNPNLAGPRSTSRPRGQPQNQRGFA